MKIIFLDDLEERHYGFSKKVNWRHEVIHTYKVEDTIEAIKANPKADILFLDHDLGFPSYEESQMQPAGTKGSGSEIAEIIAEMNPDILPKRIVFHSHNVGGAVQYMFHTIKPTGIPMKWIPYGNDIEDILSGSDITNVPGENSGS